MSTFQKIILDLQQFWVKKGCVLQQSYDLPTGAGTFNPETFLRALGDTPYNVCNVEISKRPTDGRYGENPNRMQRFHQFQVMMKPTPANFQKIFLESLEHIGVDIEKHDIRFVHDDWESPTQGASGLGWEVWCDGMEITQYTYFQQIGGVSLNVIPVELAYGIERIALFLQKKNNVYELQYNEKLTYGEVFLEGEKQFSKYNFELASTDMWSKRFDLCEKEALQLMEQNLPIPAYDMAIEASHSFNMLDARGAISTTARVSMIHRVRNLCCSAARNYLENVIKDSEEKPLECRNEKTTVPSKLKEIGNKKVDFLLEVGCEHLPVNAASMAVSSLSEIFTHFFNSFSIAYTNLQVHATAKRLALLVKCNSFTSEVVTIKKGPLIEKAFDETGKLTKQGEGFFKSIGVDITKKEDISDLSQVKVEDGRVVCSSKKAPVFVGKLLHEHLKSLILSIRFPKKMRWGEEGVLFSRPIDTIIALFDKQMIPICIEGVSSSNTAKLHDQLSGKTVTISKPSDYLAKLKKGYVLASISERRNFIKDQLETITKNQGLVVACHDEVMKEVLYLSEYPLLAIGEFDEKFLVLPDELIISEMVGHQKYWPLKDKNQAVSRKFVVAVDKKPTKVIIENNEKVLTARLSDGLFLYQKDLKSSFDDWNEKLKQVTLHPKLGSMYNKVERIIYLSKKLSKLLNINFNENAARYCKADLASDVVYEFPELQGVIGKYYAEKFGFSTEVGIGIEESYYPKSEQGIIPSTNEGVICALADKLDNLMSYIGIGLHPTSSKDPYALRRAAIGVNKILVEKKLSFDLRLVVEDPKVLSFIMDRMKGLLKDYGFASGDIECCALYQSYNPYKFFHCVEVISKFRATSSDYHRLVEVYKRLKGTVKENNFVFSSKEIEAPEEKELFKSIDLITNSFDALIEDNDFEKIFMILSELMDPLENFFDKVRVNVDSDKVRENRIALLQIPFGLISTIVKF